MLRARSSSNRETPTTPKPTTTTTTTTTRIVGMGVGGLLSSSMAASLTRSAFRISLLLLLLAAIAVACISFPVQKILKDFLLWVRRDLGPWGPFVLAFAYIPLTVLAVPASVLTLGCGYLFGLPVGFIVDSVGATMGATAAFILGRTMGRSYVISKLKNYPKFQAVAIAIRRSGFKIVWLLRLVPLLPFNMLNYLLSVTPVHLGEYMVASWLGMMPLTFALVYVGTTLKDLSDVTNGLNDVSRTRWIFIVPGCLASDKALEENADTEDITTLPGLQWQGLPVVAEPLFPEASHN
ncbi:uncharacterized protein LOC132268923 isoform X2 [Cornus florida]|uniref:uncharacterized protein LOC132268923 isoform X2 n=1 Tax=Cornus florida TaxID=4283 RepID=UPI00289BD04D|nr:uncharacterized protein LOC132268923 isoform X2 [Cornus florida]